VLYRNLHRDRRWVKLSDTNSIEDINPLNAELYPTCHLLALLEAHHILHISRIRVNVVPTG